MLIRRIGLDYMASLQADRQRALAAAKVDRLTSPGSTMSRQTVSTAVSWRQSSRWLVSAIDPDQYADQQVNVAGNLAMTTWSGTTP
jgi:hypothetical protein